MTTLRSSKEQIGNPVISAAKRTLREAVLALGFSSAILGSSILSGCGAEVPKITSSKTTSKNPDASVDASLPKDSQVLEDATVTNDSAVDAFDDDGNSSDAQSLDAMGDGTIDAQLDAIDARVPNDARMDARADGGVDASRDGNIDSQIDSTVDGSNDSMTDAIDAPIPDANDGGLDARDGAIISQDRGIDSNNFTEAGIDTGMDAPIDAMTITPDAPSDVSVQPIDSAPDMMVTPPDRSNPNDILSVDAPRDILPPDTLSPDAMADARTCNNVVASWSGFLQVTFSNPILAGITKELVLPNYNIYPGFSSNLNELRVEEGICYEGTGNFNSHWATTYNSTETLVMQKMRTTGNNVSVYFANPGAIDTSNLQGTFVFFDAFQNSVAWAPIIGRTGCTVSNGQATCLIGQQSYLQNYSVQSSNASGILVESIISGAGQGIVGLASVEDNDIYSTGDIVNVFAVNNAPNSGMINVADQTGPGGTQYRTNLVGLPRPRMNFNIFGAVKTDADTAYGRAIVSGIPTIVSITNTPNLPSFIPSGSETMVPVIGDTGLGTSTYTGGIWGRSVDVQSVTATATITYVPRPVTCRD
ncbi:MAG: DUF2341 domain-containing protein [Candidatus Micrarchaeota archaeon]